MLRVMLFAPIHTSLYSRLVLHGLLQEANIEVVGIAVRNPWNIKRMRSEYKRDGRRLLQKFIQKYLLREAAFGDVQVQNLGALIKEAGLADSDLKSMAGTNAIPYKKVNGLSDGECEQFTRNLKPDLIVFTGGGLIRKNILDIPTVGVLNCHTGVLPPFRGMDVVEWTALEGSLEVVGFGVTAHLMAKGVDTGPIIQVCTIELTPEDTFKSIRMKLEVEMVRAVLESVHALSAGMLQPKPQRKEDGRQYFVMHPRVKHQAEAKLHTTLKQ